MNNYSGFKCFVLTGVAIIMLVIVIISGRKMVDNQAIKSRAGDVSSYCDGLVKVETYKAYRVIFIKEYGSMTYKNIVYYTSFDEVTKETNKFMAESNRDEIMNFYRTYEVKLVTVKKAYFKEVEVKEE